jgi:ERCC4-related helicase
MLTIAPGARILCRDAEWLVKSTDTASDGSFIIEAIGVSEFIQGKRARFIKELEDDIQVLRPEETQLINDPSSGYVHSLLFLEAHLKQTAPDDQRLYQGQRAAMDVLDYQLWPAYKALSMPRQRILIADAVGLGKTLECGILVSELIRRGRGRRILVVTTKSMMVQFQKEFWSRFTIPLMRLDSTTIQRIRTRIPGNHNPFHYYDRTIISVDTLKQDREYRSYLEAAHWDIIIIDEAHNVAKRGRGSLASKRARLADRLATRSDTLILLSATPHDGRPESFASLMNMLDATAIADESDYTQEDIRELYVRRFKKDVLTDLKQLPERHVQQVEAQASPAEEEVFERLHGLNFQRIDSRRSASQLFKTTLLKAMLSSPAACLETVNNRIKTLKKALTPGAAPDQETLLASLPGEQGAIRHDLEQLESLRQALGPVDGAAFSKYQALLRLIRQDFGWTGQDPRDRLVIFTGRLETLRFLQGRLAQDLKLKPGALETLDGGMPDGEQSRIVEAFGQERARVRILIATEVGSEGLNLHYLSHRLIHFDIPWSLMTLQQRNGRIDRYGQTQPPQIRYLLTRSVLQPMDEVERIIKVLLAKDDQAIKNIGDPSVFMGVFDAEAEEAVTAQAIESGVSADEFSQQLDRNASSHGGEIDLVALFSNPDQWAAPGSQGNTRNPKVETGKLPTLFSSTYAYAIAALQTLDPPPPNLTIDEQGGFVELQLPAELEQRYKRLPQEIRPQQKALLHLSDRPQVVMRSMEEARREEARWPDQQYLWELHPFVEWLTDRCLFRFGRHQAPVLSLARGLTAAEAVFVLFGSFPNRRGAPVLCRWLSAVFEDGRFIKVEPFTDTISRTRLGQEPIPNPGQVPVEDLLALRLEAIQQGRRHLLAERETFAVGLSAQLEEQRSRLDKLKGRHLQQLELEFEADQRAVALRQQRRQDRLTRTEKIFKDYQDWVDLSMTTEPEPFIKLVAVLRTG